MNKDAEHDKASDNAHDRAANLAERKAKLLRQGEFHRVALLHAKEQVKHAAKPQVMLHDAFDHATSVIRSRVDGMLGPTHLNVSSLAPYALSILGIIKRRRLGKPALALTVVMAGLGWYLQRRRERQLLR